MKLKIYEKLVYLRINLQWLLLIIIIKIILGIKCIT